MDTEYLTRKLEEFRDVCQSYADTFNHRSFTGDENLKRRMQQLEPVVKQIVAGFDPRLADFNTATMAGEHDGIRAANHGLGILAHKEELARALGPDGPSIAAQDLHPWVWSAASTFWDADQYLVAVEQAAKSVNAHTQQKLQVFDLSDDKLMTEAWSDREPATNRPRLRVPGDPVTSLTTKSKQEGAGPFARGCFQGIRNVAAHTVDNGNRQVALEFLASLSVLARWISEANVARVGES